MEQDHDYSVSPKLDRLDLGAEGEFTDAPGLVVVPDHDLVERVLGSGRATDEGQDVAAEEHLHDPDAALLEFPPEDLPEGIAVVDTEAGVGASGEAAMVLVEREVEEAGSPDGSGGGARRKGGGGGGIWVGNGGDGGSGVGISVLGHEGLRRGGRRREGRRRHVRGEERGVRVRLRRRGYGYRGRLHFQESPSIAEEKRETDEEEVDGDDDDVTIDVYLERNA